jgi:hypothetical protein
MQFFDPNKPVAQPGTPSNSYYDLMLGLSDLGAKERGIKDQMMLADELRGQQGPQMRDAGRIKVAANPLEHMNSAISKGVGGGVRAQGMQAQTALADEIRRRIAEERAKQQGGGTITPTPVGNPGFPMPTTRGA